MKNIQINTDKKDLIASGKTVIKKIVAGVAVVGVVTTFAGCRKTETQAPTKTENSYSDELKEIDKIYLVPYANDVYVFATEQLDYEMSFKISSYNGLTKCGKSFSIELDDGKVMVWNTEEGIEIPVSKDGLEKADIILTNAGQEPISPCFESVKTKIK